MGRKFPVRETIINVYGTVNQDYHFVSAALFLACIAAIFAIVSSLCGSLSRKKSETPSPSPSPPPTATIIQEKSKEEEGTTQQKDYCPTSREVLIDEEGKYDNTGRKRRKQRQEEDDVEDDDALSITSQQQQQQPLPPPPGRRHLSSTVSYHFRSDSTASSSSLPTSRNKLPTSMSMKVFGNGLGSRQTSKRDQQQHHSHQLMADHEKRNRNKKVLKHEDSIWKKTIILGEKCRVPDEDEDSIFYDEKGNRISTYHPKPSSSSSSSKPLSRQNSITDPADFISFSAN